MRVSNVLRSVYARIRTHNTETFIVLSVMFVSACALLFRLGARPLWMDEQAVLWYTHQSPIEFIRGYINYPDDHAPLYYFLVIGVYRLAPLGVEALRFVSVLAAIATVCVCYYFARLVLGSRNQAWWYALTLSVSSYFLLIGQMARYHSIAGFGTVLALYAFAKMVIEGYTKRYYWLMVGAGIFVCLNDYPHFVYLVVVSNVYVLYTFLKRASFISFRAWLGTQLIWAAAFAPMVWLILKRLTFSPELGFKHASLLGNSIGHIALGVLMHVYTFFYGENILPWNYLVFGAGILCMGAAAWGLMVALRRRENRALFLLTYFVFGLIICNALFINFVNPRYNFFVYPRFGYAAYPLFILLFFRGIQSLPYPTLRRVVMVMYVCITLFGTYNFYHARNYVNASFFGSFAPYVYLEEHARPGDWLVINGDANHGLYAFYATSYFKNVRPVFLKDVDAIAQLSHPQRLWFFSTGSDGDGANQTPESKIPAGLRMIDRYDSTPIDRTLKKYKEKVLGRPSYLYKYGLFLLTNR